MKKSLFLIVFVVLWGIINPIKVQAEDCNKVLSSKHGGNNPSVSDCSEVYIVPNDAKGTHTYGGEIVCANVDYGNTPSLYQYCNNGSTITSTGSGRLMVYGASGFKIRVTVNGAIKPIAQLLGTTALDTGIDINMNDIIKIEIGEDSSLGAVGWRPFITETPENYGDINNLWTRFFQAAELDATTNGYLIISSQSWADSRTNSYYDTYDFEDGGVMLALKNPPRPTCPPASTLSVFGNNYLGDISSFNISPISLGANEEYSFVSNGFAPETNLTLSEDNNNTCVPSGSNSATSCYIKTRGSITNQFYTKTTWTHNFKIRNTNSDLYSDVCSASVVFDIYPYPGFLKTSQSGTAYIGTSMNQVKFPTEQYFASHLFISKNNIVNFPNPSPGKLSSKSRTLSYAEDSSNNNNSFFNRLKNTLTNDQRLNYININSSITIDNQYLAQRAIVTKPEVDLIAVNDLTIFDASETVNCIKPTIFLVDGDLTFSSQFKIEAGKDTACMFIVAEKVDVNYASNGQIEAFIIAHEFNTNYNNAKLEIKGGVVLQKSGDTASFNRNINASILNAGDIQKNTSSEEIKYEGARYIKFFGKYLREPIQLSIRELQY